MASSFESLEKMPVWQRLAVWVVIAAAILAIWYFVFFLDAVAAREGAEVGLDKSTTELTRLEGRRKNHLEEQRQHEERKAKLRERMGILPMSSSTVDNMMQTFQQKARQVGLSFDSWTNETEERQDVYARLPVSVSARGSWAQAGEFFRQLSTLEQSISIESLELVANEKNAEVEHPRLDLEFEAATYRALSPEERNAPTKGRAKPSRRKGKKK